MISPRIWLNEILKPSLSNFHFIKKSKYDFHQLRFLIYTTINSLYSRNVFLVLICRSDLTSASYYIYLSPHFWWMSDLYLLSYNRLSHRWNILPRIIIAQVFGSIHHLIPNTIWFTQICNLFSSRCRISWI